MGVRDYRTTQVAAIVDRACWMWEGVGIWSVWMGRRYVRERPLSLIEPRQSDSSAWKRRHFGIRHKSRSVHNWERTTPNHGLEVAGGTQLRM